MGFLHVVHAEPYIPNNQNDSAIDGDYIDGEYVIPVDGCSTLYEHEID